MKLPRKLRTMHYPGNKVEIWMNNKKISNIQTLNLSERHFMKLFITNLKELGWNVLVDV
jgi:hypothetical protein